MTLIRIITLLSTYVVLVGCAMVDTKNVPISDAGGKQLANQTLTISSRNNPDFAASTPTNMSFGLIGALTAISNGNEIIAENQVENPAKYIADTLAQDIAYTYNASVVPRGDKIAINQKTSDIASLYADSDYVLDVETINWSFIYFPTAWNSYRVLYSAKLRLIDTAKKTIVSESFCKRVPESSENAPSYDGLLAFNAERLKKELKIAADVCIAEFRSNTLLVKANPEGTALAYNTGETDTSVGSDITTVIDQNNTLSTEVEQTANNQANESNSSDAIDISGTYRLIVTGGKWVFRDGYRDISVKIRRNGNEGWVASSDPSIKLSVKQEGNTVLFTTGDTPLRCSCSYVESKVVVSNDGRVMEGDWNRSGGAKGTWTLTKVY